MNEVSNGNNCYEGSYTNIAMKYTLRFEVLEPGKISWHIPLDLGRGGMVIVNGAVVKSTSEDIWDGG